MEGLGVAANVAALIDISAKIASVCYQYSVAVKNANNDIDRLQKKVSDVHAVLKRIKQLLDGPGNARLSATRDLTESLEQCLQELKQLDTNLEPRKSRKAMSKFGVRALKWPFTSKQIEKSISNLETYKHAFTLALQVDQTAFVLDIDKRIDLVAQSANNIQQRLDLSKLPIAKGAFFDSHMEEHNSRCLANTRTELLEQIHEWSRDDKGKSLFWLSGMAGTGKSTIARTIAQSLSDQGQLGASFFFKKGEAERGNATRFFTTIASDLAVRVPESIPGISKALETEPNISDKILKNQFEKLILEPLSNIQQGSSLRTRVVVIDALDECERDEDVRVILHLLSQTKDMKPFALRILVTSRPELPIRLGFRQMADGTYQDLILHAIPKSVIEHDIRLFLEHELREIQLQRSLSPDWPTRNEIQELVELAVPLFIFAATICRYIGTKGSDPEDYLNKVLSYQKANFSQMDRTYLPVLDQLLAEQEGEDKETWLESFGNLVGAIALLETPLCIPSIARLLQIPQQRIQVRLDSLHSVLSIPIKSDIPVRLLHLSFREFLFDHQKQGKSPFWIDKTKIHEQLTYHCIDLMSGIHGLRRNLCKLSSPGISMNEIDRANIAAFLPSELQYACRYWVYHLLQHPCQIEDGDRIDEFLQNYFIFWLEAMILLGEINECIRLVNKLEELTKSSNSLSSRFLRDAERFILRFRWIIEEAPLQIYCSALAFAPKTSLIKKAFYSHVPDWLEVLSKPEDDWGECLNVFEGHSSGVRAVAFSGDSRLVASGGEDKTVRIWDAVTGSHISTLEGHSGSADAVCISSDKRFVVTGSEDQSVRLWNIATGLHYSTLKGHLDCVTSVRFSPNNQWIASASKDRTIKLWDVLTGLCSDTFTGHTAFVNEVVFSPNGDLIASASWDKTVRLWEIETSTCCFIFEGHSENVKDVTFSSDARFIASADSRGSIRLWEVEKRICSRILKVPHYSTISIAISPDNTQIFVGCYSKTYPAVSIWDIATGANIKAFVDHAKRILSVAFSVDCHLVATASISGTVHLWETATKSVDSVHKESSRVSDTQISPDGTKVALASYDGEVRMWDIATRSCSGKFHTHLRMLDTLIFSPNSEFLVTASHDDAELQLWDAELQLWDAATTSCCWARKGYNRIGFLSNSYCASRHDNEVQILDVATGSCSKLLKGHSDLIVGVWCAPDGRLVASSSLDGEIRIWDVASESCIRAFQVTSGRVWDLYLVFSPDNQLLASTGNDQKIRVWDVKTGSCRNISDFRSTRVAFLAFSEDSQTIALMYIDSKVSLWDVATGFAQNKTHVDPYTLTFPAFPHFGKHASANSRFATSPIYSRGTYGLQSGANCLSFNLNTWITRAGHSVVHLPSVQEVKSIIAVSKDTICIARKFDRLILLKFKEGSAFLL